MKLSEFERETVLWKRMEAELQDTLQILREKNDGMYEAAETMHIRGQIQMVKKILDWGKPPGPEINTA